MPLGDSAAGVAIFSLSRPPTAGACQQLQRWAEQLGRDLTHAAKMALEVGAAWRAGSSCCVRLDGVEWPVGGWVGG